MAHKTFADGDVLTAGDVNTYLMNQAVAKQTSGTRPSSPTEGQYVDEADTNVLRRYSGSSWRRYAVDLETHQANMATESTAQTSITSTTAAAGSVNCGLSFIVPPSGILKITVAGSIAQSVDGNLTYLGWEIRTGGTVGSGSSAGWDFSTLRAITAGRPVNSGSAAVTQGSFPFLVGLSGELTVGNTYNVRTMHSVTSGGTGTVSNRILIVEPIH